MAKHLGEFEQLILFAILRIGDAEAYGASIREMIQDRTGRKVSPGAVYTALDRLEERGLVSSEIGAPTAERGGRRKRLFTLEPTGIEALHRAAQVFHDMSHGLLPQLDHLASGREASS